MEAIYHIFSWGSPLGVGLFLFLLSGSAAVLIRAIADLKKVSDEKDK